MSSAAPALRQAPAAVFVPDQLRVAPRAVQFDAAKAMQISKIVAWRLRERGVLRRSEVEGFAGDLVAEVVRRWPQYDPDRSGVTTFMSMVIENRARSLLRSLGSAKRGRGRCRNLTDSNVKNLETLASRARRCATVPDQVPRTALRMDVDVVIAAMPEHLKRACALLKGLSPAEAARKLGVPRHRLYALIREIRQNFIAAGWEAPA